MHSLEKRQEIRRSLGADAAFRATAEADNPLYALYFGAAVPGVRLAVDDAILRGICRLAALAAPPGEKGADRCAFAAERYLASLNL